MDILNMVMTAEVRDTSGVVLGGVLAVQFVAGHMIVTVLVDEEEEETGDDDGGEEITPEETGELRLIRPVAEALRGGKT